MPLILHQKPLADTQLCLWQVKESLEELEELFQSTEQEKRQLAELKYEKRKKEYIGARILLKYLLRPNASITYTDNKQPLVEGHHISISHTRDYIALLLNPKQPVGIDIEYLSNRVDRIKPKFLSQKEAQDIADQSHPYQTLLYWCAKECLFKLYGKGNVVFAKNLGIYQENGQWKAQFNKPDEQFTLNLHHFIHDKELLITYLVKNKKNRL